MCCLKYCGSTSCRIICESSTPVTLKFISELYSTSVRTFSHSNDQNIQETDALYCCAMSERASGTIPCLEHQIPTKDKYYFLLAQRIPAGHLVGHSVLEVVDNFCIHLR